MDVHAVHLEHSHSIDLLLKEVKAPEVTRHIHMEASIWEPRCICNSTALDLLHRAVPCHLCKSLTRIEHSGLGSSLDLDTLRRHSQLIAFWGNALLYHSHGHLRLTFKRICAFCYCYVRRNGNDVRRALCESSKAHQRKQDGNDESHMRDRLVIMQI